MESISAIQQQYPLSPKKFWKKMIEKLSALYVLAIMGIVIDLVVIFMTNDTYNTTATMILWAALVAILIILAIISILYGWYVKTYIKRYYYSGEENFITIKKGVFAPTEIHVQWQKIQDVYVDQDILDRIMGLYDVHIASATASSGIEAHIDGIDHISAEGLKKFLLDKVSNAGRNNNVQANNFAEPVDQTQQNQIQKATIKLSEDISSNSYPLSEKWTIVSLLGRLIWSFIFPAFIVLILFGNLKNFSFIDYWVYFVLGWFALSILTMIVRTITLFMWKKNYAFNFTPDHIYYREGVISMSEKHMPYSSVQDVTVKQSVMERIFGLAKVVIENAAQQQMIVGRHGQQIVGFAGIVIQGLSLPDANKITDILKTTVLGKNNSRYGL